MIPQRKAPADRLSGLPSNTEAALLAVENERLKILMRLIVPAAASYERRVERIGQYPELMPYLTPDDLAANIEQPYARERVDDRDGLDGDGGTDE